MLLDQYARRCVLLIQTRVPDGAGGFHTTWTDGAAFTLYPALDSSMEARRAEKDGVTSLYGCLAHRDAVIHHGDWYRDEVTGETFRVTSLPEDKTSPMSATFALKHFTAERKELPT